MPKLVSPETTRKLNLTTKCTEQFMDKGMTTYYRYFESGRIHTVEQIPITKEHRKKIKHRRIMRLINKERLVLNLSWLFE